MCIRDSSAARLRVSWWTAALEALYAGCHCGRLTMKADIEPMLMMLPDRLPTMCSPNTWDIVHNASRFTDMTERQSSSVTSKAGLWMQVPALLIKTSTFPNAFKDSDSARSTSPRVQISARTIWHRWPAASTISAVFWDSAESRAIITVSYTHLRAHETRHDLVC